MARTAKLSLSCQTVLGTIFTSPATQSIITSTLVFLAGKGKHHALTSLNDEASFHEAGGGGGVHSGGNQCSLESLHRIPLGLWLATSHGLWQALFFHVPPC
jgi:hypothetical protein